MFRFYSILFIMLLVFDAELLPQSQKYLVKRAPFSSGINDEFSPVYFKDGIVFCSNIRDNSPVGYKDEQGRLFKIVYAGRKGSSGWKPAILLSQELTSGFNDGPATFSSSGTKIYFSRNNNIGKNFRNINDTSNKLGIYSAELVGNEWKNIIPVPFNNPLYTLTTPSLSPDGKRIYFSSDMPGGYGGLDLYFCDSFKNGWSSPVNLGPFINTPKNESFPFAAGFGMLFFASDGHQGFGGKDIFYTREIEGQWIVPVHLESAINSPADDFGLVADSTLGSGYFSTNRLKTDDIFSFVSAPELFTDCDSIRDNRYCFTFYDEQHKQIDTVPASYIWEFGDGIKKYGVEVKHCFPGPGKYVVNLTILDELTGDTIADQTSYDVELEEIGQPVIRSSDIGLTDKPLSFEGVAASLRDITITDYYWNFGDGFKPGAPLMNYTYKRKGDYLVQLGLQGEDKATGISYKGCVMKRIRIFNSFQMAENAMVKSAEINYQESDNEPDNNVILETETFLMDDLSERQKNVIKTGLKEIGSPFIMIDRNGLSSTSYPKLDKLTGLMKENPDLRLEINVYAIKPSPEGASIEVSEGWAQEIAFFFRNAGMAGESITCKGYGIRPSVFVPGRPDDKMTGGIAEIVFMKK